MATNMNIDRSGDAADQAELLREAVDLQAAGAVGGREVSDGRGYPLEDVEDVLSAEDADDASDDPLHAGGLNPHRWLSAEESAMHIITTAADQMGDGFDDDGPDDASALTPEDETLLGLDPYDPATHQKSD